MGIDNEIQKMEEALRKKRLLRTEKAKARVLALKGRVETKTVILEKVQSEIDKLMEEIEQIEAYMIQAGSNCKKEVTEQYIPELKKPTVARKNQ